MGNLPRSKEDRLVFFENRIALWTTNASDIGVLPSECTALSALITAARSAFTDQGIAADNARSATLNADEAIQTMYTLGKAMVQKINAYAESTGNTGVYTLSNIAPPASPTPVGPPGKPSDLVVEILVSGALSLKWKCENPPGASGTVYEVRRKIGSAPAVLIGAGGSDKVFVDDTLPLGSSVVAYIITGLRGTTRGPGVQFTVNFGVTGGGGFAVASVTEGTVVAAKMAA